MHYAWGGRIPVNKTGARAVDLLPRGMKWKVNTGGAERAVMTCKWGGSKVRQQKMQNIGRGTIRAFAKIRGALAKYAQMRNKWGLMVAAIWGEKASFKLSGNESPRNQGIATSKDLLCRILNDLRLPCLLRRFPGITNAKRWIITRVIQQMTYFSHI